jgi:tyrosinase
MTSPLFDGSETSLGGNGAASNQNAAAGSLGGAFAGGAGTGGGCVSTGPFKKYVEIANLFVDGG